MRSTRLRKADNLSITRDVSGEAQQALKIMEGTVASVPPQGGRTRSRNSCVDTTNILFICGASLGWTS